MDIFVLLLFSILVYLLPNNNDYLGVKSTTGLKGFLAIGIVFHHLSQSVSTGGEFINFKYMGTYIVSIFLFLTAYGLYVQNERKKNYLNNFLTKRLARVVIPALFVSGIYIVYFVFNKQTLPISYFINLFVKGATIIANGWFVDVIILLYMFFYISFKVFSNKGSAIFCNTIFVIIYIILAIILKYDFWWYNSTLPFVVGVVGGKYKANIDDLLNNNYFMLLLILTGLLFISHHYDFLLRRMDLANKYSLALVANLDNVIFTIFFILIVRKIDFSNKYLLFLGKISFELYMIHGLVISIVGKYFFTSRLNDVIFSILVLIISIILAWLVNLIINKISIKAT